MTPLWLELTNYRSFRGTHRIDFQTGASAVVGANGSGKSTVIGAPDFALFGPQSRSVEPYVSEGTDEMRVTLGFDHAGTSYRVRRSWKRGKSALDFEQLEDVPTIDVAPAWRSLTQGSAADTQDRVEATIGMARSTFRASGYLAQRQSDTFTGAQPRDRKRILSDALALDAWQTDCDKVGVDRRTIEKRIGEVGATVDGLAERAAQADPLTVEAGDLRLLVDLEQAGETEARTVAETQAQRAADLDAADTRWKLATAAAATAQTALDGHQALMVRTMRAREEIAVARNELYEIGNVESADDLEVRERALTAQHEEYRLAVHERNAATAKQDQLAGRRQTILDDAADLRSKASRTLDLIGSSQHCETCKQTLGEEAARTAAATFVARALDLDDAAAAIAAQVDAIAIPDVPGDEPDASQIDGLRQRIQSARRLDARVLEVNTKIVGLERIVGETDTDEYREEARRLEFEARQVGDALAAVKRPEPGASDQARAAALQAKAKAEAHASRARSASERLAVVGALLEQAQAALVEHGLAVAERDRLHTDLDILARLEQAFGRDGVPAWIVESQAVPQIESEANRILARLGGAISRVELRTERETKAGEKRDALDVVCLTDDGERALETFSGGEQSRAEIALALGLVGVLANRRGADLRYLALDEPSGLDSQGTEALAEVLRERAAGSVVLLASHDPGLRDQFDQSVVVTRGPSGSAVSS